MTSRAVMVNGAHFDGAEKGSINFNYQQPKIFLQGTKILETARMTDFVTRPVEVNDLDSILELCHAERWPLNENMLLSIWKRDASGWFVAERDGEILGNKLRPGNIYAIC